MSWNLSHLFIVLLLVLAVAYWWESRGSKAWALHHARQRCRARGLQLLDQSVVVSRIRLQRGEDGRLGWWRQYRFEFSPNGVDRYRGLLELRGRICTHLEMEAYVDN